MLTLINPVPRAEPFDHPDWVFKPKFDGFRAVADTVRGRLLSRNGARVRRYEGVLDLLSKGCVFDDEPVVLDDAGRPLFHELLFGRGRPTYVAFDLLEAHCVDLRPLPFWQHKAMLAAVGKRAFTSLRETVPGRGEPKAPDDFYAKLRATSPKSIVKAERSSKFKALWRNP